MEYGCSQCIPCRINKSRLWVGRMLLELSEHKYSCFVTLTYNEESIPVGGILKKKDLQDFLKRLRWNLGDREIRYFAVGEYGEVSWRPHYHLIIFGLSPTESEILEKSWKKGFVHVGTAEAKSMAYVCSYVLKNMRCKNDKRLEGRYPEFSIMSKRPGLGFGVVSRVRRAYETEEGKEAIKEVGWFSEGVRIGGKKYALGRYLKSKIEEGLGLDKEQKKAHRKKYMFKMYAIKEGSTIQYEVKRKAAVEQQMGRNLLKKEVI